MQTQPPLPRRNVITDAETVMGAATKEEVLPVS